MSKNLKYFDIDLPINDKRDIRGIVLENGITIVLISDLNIKTSSCSVGVKAGYLQDEFEGTAHFLEHLLFMGSSKFPEQNTYHSYVQSSGGFDNAYTGDNITCYYLELENEFLERGIEMLSWFFREPILDMKHIESEMNIINSEHQKNLLSDVWIMDDIFKKFVIKSKYSNFGTGNMESLKDITKEDIMKFYNKYYTTDNLFVCIVDNIDVKSMIHKYLKYFEEIPEKKYTGETDRFSKLHLETIYENLIVFNSISQYNFLNYYIVLNCNDHNQQDVQLLNLLSYIIGTEYTNSFTYFLKENGFATNIRTNLDYYYDYEAIIGINIILANNNIENIKTINLYLNSLLNKISNLDKNEFAEIYDAYRRINLLHLLYKNKQSSSDTSNDVVDNLMKSDKCLCVIRKNAVPEYNDELFIKFKELLDDIEIKMTTNLNVEKREETEFLISEHYKTKYYITKYIVDMGTAKINYILKNIILYPNIYIKTEVISSIDKKELPKLILKNELRELYLLEFNKYDKPILNISMIRKNSKYIHKEHNLILNIYKKICLKILNYYLDTNSNYKMYFTMNISDEYLIYNFNGLYYLMKQFLNEIIKKISYESIIKNSNVEKYFDEIKMDLIEGLVNLKYETPYSLCLKYFSIILSDDFRPTDAINYIKKLKFKSFLEQLDKLLIFEKEQYIITGNIKNCSDKFECGDEQKYALEYIDLLSDNPLRYVSTSMEYVSPVTSTKIHEQLNYVLTKQEFNSKEINNCLVDCYLIKTYDLNLLNNVIEKKQLMKIFKDKLIIGMISNLINEPLFDKIRTIDKLGYIVKSNMKYHTVGSKAMIFICYLIQSDHKMKNIYKSVDNFNELFYKNFKNNKNNFKKLFENLKKSKELELSKDTTDLDEESFIYLSTILNKYGDFNYQQINLKILKKITFEDVSEIINYIFTNVIRENRYYVILDTNK